ncbi:cytochrome P450 [Yinghuangia sp. ASG 101]|uniref:cytochrome P450 n=1 Tax=Yinghuangia sp. ASG 101 TaxID=2896848 RepID=UPI001E5BFE01|nr:cytochrome P450 [Yinghuangia sp. ASG 101]UGQ11011.1 cytochrome P450 [Yinghuangia sp. ASG 101]
MSIDDAHPATGEDRKKHTIDFDRHSTAYRTDFEEITQDLHSRCPVAWTGQHGGYWLASGNQEVFDLARRADLLSNDNDVKGERKGYFGITIPHRPRDEVSTRGGFLEMDPPEQRHYRQALNPYLSPAAVARWQPVMNEITRACIDERIETGTIDFVDDLANIVPAVMTMALLGLPLRDWEVFCEPAHATVYTKPDSPEMAKVIDGMIQSYVLITEHIGRIRAEPRPGLIDALVNADINGSRPTDQDITESVMLLIGGGFDTTTALTAHSLEWLAENPAERERLSRERDVLLDSATEEFLRYFTPAVGDGRTIAADCEVAGTRFKEGERLWLSWAMANRDARVFDAPDTVLLDRKGNRHASFGLGIHRCIGSNFARKSFKTMLTHVLDRMPDYTCVAEGTVHYDTTGLINGMKHLPAIFTPGRRLGAGIDETLDALQKVCDEQGLAAPVTANRATARPDR